MESADHPVFADPLGKFLPACFFVAFFIEKAGCPVDAISFSKDLIPGFKSYKAGCFPTQGCTACSCPAVALANFGFEPVLAACGLCHRRRVFGFQTAFDAASTCLFESRSRSASGKQSIFLFAHGDSEAGSKKGKERIRPDQRHPTSAFFARFRKCRHSFSD